MELNQIYNLNCLEGLKQLPDESVQCCVTSPPYWGLRDYKVKGQLGMEKTPNEFIRNMVEVFSEVKRALKKDGTLWVNIGDSYASAGKNRTTLQATAKTTLAGSTTTQEQILVQMNKVVGDLKPKDLVGIPWMLAFALRTDGWFLRQEIIWNKPNPMPESVEDRCTRAHENIFMFSKSARYFYDHESIKSEAVPHSPNPSHFSDGTKKSTLLRQRGEKQRGHSRRHAGFNDRWDNMTTKEQQAMGANKRSVWTVATQPFPEAHFATFPEEIPDTCILAGSKEGDTILDPFMGAGTTALVARKRNRNFIGFELNPDYIKIAENRLKKELGMFQ